MNLNHRQLPRQIADAHLAQANRAEALNVNYVTEGLEVL